MSTKESSGLATTDSPVDKTVPDVAEPGKMKRISDETKGLVDDVKSWVDLKMTLMQMDVEDKVDSRVNKAAVGAIVGALVFLIVCFGLVSAALGLGSLLGHDAWGFLAVAGLLVLIALFLLALKPRLIDISSGHSRRDRSND